LRRAWTFKLGKDQTAGSISGGSESEAAVGQFARD
jgi:hypothetical protein